jgi:hypothetical protein
MMQAALPKWSVRERQMQTLRTMLGARDSSDEPANPSWKVLIYDDVGQDVLSPLMNVSDLRELGVTLYLNLFADRQAIEDVPAVYFVSPTQRNVQRICQDFKSNLYETYELNFLTAVPRDLLDMLAASAVEANCAQYVLRVFDLYSNFVTLEDDFFVSRHRNTQPISYQALNNPEVKDQEIEASMDDIVGTLFSALVTLGTVPIIRCSRRNAAENIAKRLEGLLRDHLKNTKSQLFSESAAVANGFQRPVLILLDRNVDTTTVLHHTWTYQALVHDLLDFQLNRVCFYDTIEKDGVSRKVERTFDLDKNDVMWQRCRGKPFPEVAAAIEEELREFKEKDAEIKALHGGLHDEAVSEDLLSQGTSKLTSAINSLPQLLAKKKCLDMHTTLLTAVMTQLGERHLDAYYEMEEEIMNKKKLSRQVLDLLSDPEAGMPEDRLRCYIIYYMDSDLAQDECDRCEAVLRSAGCDLAPLAHLREMKKMQRLTHTPAITASHKSDSLFSHASKMMKIGEDLWKQGVKKLLPTSGDLPVTRIAESLMELKENEMTREYLYLDPKLLRGSGSGAVPKGRPPFDDAIVFVVGGGNYTEYQNLVDFSERSQGKRRIIYGTSELMNANSFLSQLSQLGKAATF